MSTANASKPNLNPLFLDAIVYKLFEYLPLKDIIIQRGVCKFWQEIGLKRLRNKMNAIRISFDLEYSIEEFLKMAKRFPFKFTNFAIGYRNDGWIDDANSQTDRLFNEYGTHMKAVALNLLDSTYSWRFLSDVLVNKAPNIERLHLESYQRWLEPPELFPEEKKPELKLKHLSLFANNEPNDLMYSQTLLAELFASSPCLESLTVAFDTEDGMSLNSHGVMIILVILADKGNISNLKELSLNVIVGYDIVFEILATSFKTAPLEKFWIGIYEMDQPMLAHFETFFDDHKDTLKDLNFCFPCVKFLSKLRFPIMNELKVLSIRYWWISDVGEKRLPLGVFNFGKLFPNLRTLNVFEDPIFEVSRIFNFDEMFPEEATPLLTLKNLRLPPISMPAILRQMKRIFPNVLKLDIVPRSAEVFRELWITWPEIKTLRVLIKPQSYFCRNLDSIFTGVAGSDHSRNLPSISNLKKLKHLIIDEGQRIPGSVDVADFNIKDETARLALAKMKELVLLHISQKRQQISPSCVQHLCSELGMLRAETEAGDGALHLVKYEWQKRSRWPNLLDYE